MEGLVKKITAKITDKNSSKRNIEKKVIQISVFSGFLTAIAELIMSGISGSQAVLMDAVFDIAEVLVSMAFVFVLPLIYKPETEKMPFGYAQLESIFMIVKGFMLTLITLGLIKDNILIMLGGGSKTDSLLISGFEMGVGIFSFAILFIITRINKRKSSPILKSEIMSWKIDVFCCIGVSLAFLMQFALSGTRFAFIARYIDQAVAIIIASCMLPEAVKIVIAAFKNLILVAPDEEATDYIKKISKSETEKYSFNVSYCDVVQTGRKIWVEIYVKNNYNYINIYHFKIVKNNIEKRLKNKFTDIYVEITPDLE